MQFFKLYKAPISGEQYESWAKICEDMSKVGILALPMLIYGEYSLLFKIYNVSLLTFCCYSLLCLGKFFRSNKKIVCKKEECDGIH